MAGAFSSSQQVFVKPLREKQVDAGMNRAFWDFNGVDVIHEVVQPS